MKRIVCIGIALLLLLAAAGCATTTPAPTASPLATALVPSPGASMMPSTAPDSTGGTGGGTAGTGTIPNFAAGTEVTEADVPEITTALQDKYEGATITRITHGMQGTQQVYVVEYKTQDGKTDTAYIAPGGAFVTPEQGGTNGNSTANPSASGSPGVSTSPGASSSPGAAASPKA